MEINPDINFETICRICIKPSLDMQNIFAGNLVNMLKNLAPISVDPADGLPQQVCKQCMLDICKSFSFKTMLIRNHADLRAILHTRKNKVDNCAPLEVEVVVKHEEIVEVMPAAESEKYEHMIECKICKTQCHNLADHMKNHINTNPPWQCQVCYKIMPSRSKLIAHMRRHTGETPYNCSECQEAFREMRLLKVHIWKAHTGICPYTCDICKRSYSSRKCLVKHKTLHTERGHFPCTECSKSFTQADYRDNHFKRKHSTERPFLCTDCGNTYVMKCELEKHMRTEHSTEERIRQFGCPQCDKKFFTAADLRGHVTTVHSDERPHQCSLCGTKFKRTSGLGHHMRSAHTVNKAHPCQHCEKSFPNLTTLKKHLRTHTGERPFSCHLCGRAFGQKSTLNTHMKRVHRDVVVS